MFLKHCKDLPKMVSLTPSSISMKPATCKHISFTNTTKYLQRLGILFSSLFEVLLSPGLVGFIWVVVVLTCPSWLLFSISIQTISNGNFSQDVMIQTWRVKTKNFLHLSLITDINTFVFVIALHLIVYQQDIFISGNLIFSLTLLQYIRFFKSL